MRFRCYNIILLLATATTTLGQETQPTLTPQQVAELERARTIITDTNASPEVRRFGAEDLLRLGYPAATELAIEILGSLGEQLPRVAVCEAIVALGARDPSKLDQGMVEPLLDLLGSPDQMTRTKAAAALSSFRTGDVAARLGELAADLQVPIAQRLAAVDALAPNVAHRTVIEQLIRLLEAEDDDLRRRVTSALRPASRVDCGTDVARWRQWWEGKRTLDEADWLLDRVELLTGRNRELQTAMYDFRAEQQQRDELLSRRLGEELEARYRLTPPAQKDELLIHWLADQVVEYRRTALSLIRSNISDNDPPPETVRAAMRNLFADQSTELRRAVFDVIAALTDPADAEPVRARLAQESEPEVREAILRTLGRLQNPSAIPDLTGELADPEAATGCVTEAAVSLGLLASLGAVDPAALAPAIAPLKQRFAAAGPEELHLRAALLGAMADIAATEFSEEFLANLDAAEPDLLLPALTGVRTIGDASRMDRILALVGHNDARVRRRAIEAVAALDGEAGHAEALFQRLHPGIEPDETVRQAAWEGFRSILTEVSPAVRFQWADRLGELPELEEAYLAELVQSLAGQKPVPAECTDARLWLAKLYEARARPADALPLWRDSWQALVEAGDSRAGDVGLSLLRATLDAGRYDGLDELLTALIAGLDAATREPIGRVVLGHLNARPDGADAPDMSELLDSLERLPADAFDASFREAVRAARAELAAAEAQPTTAPAETQ
jgi:HEAT repeat protein